MTESTRSLAASRPARRWRSTAAALALTAGLAGCLAPAALADPAPASAAPGAGFTFAAGDKSGVFVSPGLQVHSSASFDVAPGARIGLGTTIKVVYTFTNTGDVPFDKVGPHQVRLDVGASYRYEEQDLPVSRDDVELGYVHRRSTWTVRTPVGSFDSPPSYYFLELPFTLG